MIEILYGAATGLLQLTVTAVLLAPFAWWSARKRGEGPLKRHAFRPLLFVAIIYVSISAVLRIPHVGVFVDMQWNWQNKILVIASLIVIVIAIPGITWRKIGVKLPQRRWWIPVLQLIVIVVGVQFFIGPLTAMPGTAESLGFQLTLPGLDEELMFRGLLLLLLDQALRSAPNDTTDVGAPIRWSAAASTLLFGLAHGLIITDGFALLFDPASIIFTGLLGAFLVWLRIRWDSLLPAVIAHNAVNSSIVIANMFAG